MNRRFVFSQLYRYSSTGVLIVLFIFLASCTGRKHQGEEVIRGYESQAGVITFKIPPGLIGLFLSGNKSQDTKDAFSEMESIKLILVDMAKVEAENIPDFTSDFEDKLFLSGFESFFVFNEEGSKVHILTLDEEEQIRELMVLVSGESEFLGISLTGQINPDRFVDIARELKVNDFHLD